MANGFIHQKLLGAFVKTNGSLSQPFFGGMGHVFMLHRILPQRERDVFTINRSLSITPEALERWILFFRQKNYEFISLGEMYLRITGQKKSAKKWIVFTIDDGYKDNLTHGLPIFEKHQVPFSIYVASCFPNQTALYWWYLMEHQFTKHSSITVKDAGEQKTFSWHSEKEALALYKTVRSICKKYTLNEFQDFVRTSIIDGEEINRRFQEELALSWEEIKALAAHPLVTIGAHTQNHLSLRHQTQETVVYEIGENKKEIEEHIQQSVVHFAYPYGSKSDVSPKEYDVLKQADFQSAVYNEPGSVFKSKSPFAFQIPRMGLTDETSVEKVNHLLTGITHFREYGFNKTIV